jgi:hypothetical protein
MNLVEKLQNNHEAELLTSSNTFLTISARSPIAAGLYKKLFNAHGLCALLIVSNVNIRVDSTDFRIGFPRLSEQGENYIHHLPLPNINTSAMDSIVYLLSGTYPFVFL